ncbi:MAG TPA: ROK family transcriptional regulator [Anaerolineae bacterium]|nr:ROK family transcriptional regulator [Anaerolineae bacterium]
MSLPRTITAQDMRSINRSAILEIIRREGPVSRNTIADRLDVSLPTVMRVVDDLIKEDLVRPQSATQWTGGRRRALLEFNPEGQVVIGVDLGRTKMFGAIADLAGNVLGEADMSRHRTSGEKNFQRLTELIDTLLAHPKIKGRRIRGIGVGAPGITRHKEGIVTWAYTLKWHDFPLKARLDERYNLPIAVDNDVNFAALGELWFGAEQNVSNMVFITIGTGIGAGIIIDGALYRGAHEASGEIGGMLPDRQFLGKRYEEFGVLETIASGTGIAERARQALKGRRKSEELEQLLAEDVFDAARQGQTWAKKLIDETVDCLAVAIANLTVTFDPELIVLGGGVTRSADLLIEPILCRIDGVIPALPRLVVSSLERRAVVMGAVTNVLHNTSDFFMVRKLS